MSNHVIHVRASFRVILLTITLLLTGCCCQPIDIYMKSRPMNHIVNCQEAYEVFRCISDDCERLDFIHENYTYIDCFHDYLLRLGDQLGWEPNMKRGNTGLLYFQEDLEGDIEKWKEILMCDQ